MWAKNLGVDQVGAADDFFELDSDSIAAAQLSVEVQQRFGRSLPLTALLKGITVRQLAEIVGCPEAEPSSSALVALQMHGARPPFFFVHGVGGEVLCFKALAGHFAPDQPFYGIRTVSPAEADEGPTHVEALAAHYVEEIRTLQPAGPYYLGGFSFGGSVAFEMAQQLNAQGHRVAFLAILDHVPPPTRYRTAFWKPQYWMEFVLNLPCWVADDLLHNGPGKTLAVAWRKARNAARRTASLLRGGTTVPTDADSVFDREQVPEPFWRALERHYEAMRAYVPQAYQGPVTLFRARTRPLLRLHGWDLSWGKLAAGGLEVVTVPGNHATMLVEPHVAVLAERLQDGLRRAQDREGRTQRAHQLSALSA
jgi:thioesterase domain-containing protein/acyl carrier protein